jgi:hypothetical protein
MEKIEKILKKLSNLYEFNRKLQTYKMQTTTTIKGQQSGLFEPDNVRGLDVATSRQPK